MRRLLASALLALLAWAATSGAAPDASAAGPRVTVISDSVLTSVAWYPQNIAILDEGVDLDMHVAVCRRLAGTSCVFEGSAPPTLLDLVPTLPDIASTVVVEMGYNDFPGTFRANVDKTIRQLTARGAGRIVWPTLNVSKPEFAGMNDVLVQEMLDHPQLSLVDWDTYSDGHPDWFQTDNLHLMPSGGTGIATLLHGALASPLRLPTQATLPAAKRGVAYRASLGGPAGGSWTLLSGKLAPGLRLASNGALSGRPSKAGTFTAELLFRSADFQLTHRHVEIRVASAPAPTVASKAKHTSWPLLNVRRIAVHERPR